MGDHLFTPGYGHLAHHGIIDKHSIRPVQILFKLYPQIGRENWVVETAESQKSKLKNKKKMRVSEGRSVMRLLTFDF